MKSKKFKVFLFIILAIFSIQACRMYYFRSDYSEANAMIHDPKNMSEKMYLKAHLKNGEVVILDNQWMIDTINNTVTGNGKQFNFNRELTSEGSFIVPIDSVAIFETNQKLTNPETGRIVALSIMAGIDVVIGMICITNPKACFGSCPTFYVNENDNFHFADAEGFSNAISPTTAYGDIDAIGSRKIKEGHFSITMKNEALETHCVKEVKLLAYPIIDGRRVFHAQNDSFYLCDHLTDVSSASANEGGITPLLKSADHNERFSLADEHNLSCKENVYLDFKNQTNIKSPALIIDFRQTLMTTYFFYSAMGYMGDEIGDIFAKIETDPSERDKLNGGVLKELGKIDVFLFDESTAHWVFQGSFNETGPIAINHQILALHPQQFASDYKIKLVLNKGLWRIDYAGLANIIQTVQPVELSPVSVLNKGKIDETALEQLNQQSKLLISMPGSHYKLNFELPDDHSNYDLFIYSEGYYLEWMRQHWLKDKNLLKLKQMVDAPRMYLLSETSDYKKYESEMEKVFWDSKIDTKSFSYYENGK